VIGVDGLICTMMMTWVIGVREEGRGGAHVWIRKERQQIHAQEHKKRYGLVSLDGGSDRDRCDRGHEDAKQQDRRAARAATDVRACPVAAGRREEPRRTGRAPPASPQARRAEPAVALLYFSG
jgi:hypothetical protein